jgi:hypothetical protein
MAKKIEYKNAKAIIYDLIKKKKTDEFIIEKTLELFPDSLVDNKHCTKYRRELFVAGEIDASLAAVRSQDHQVWAQDNMTAAKRGVHKIYWKARATIEKAVEEAKKKLKTAKKRKVTKGKKAPTTSEPIDNIGEEGYDTEGVEDYVDESYNE